MTVVYVICVPATPYQVPTDSMQFLFSAYALVVVWKYIQRRKRPIQRTALPLSAVEK
jgi:signal peptidase I